MKACDDRIAQLVDTADGAGSVEFAAHLAHCAGCRTELDAFRATSLLLEQTRTEPADLTIAGFAHRVTDVAELRRDGTLRGLWKRLGWKQRFSVGLGAGTCAALGAALVLATGLAPGVGSPESVPTWTARSTPPATADRLATVDRGLPGSEAERPAGSTAGSDVEALLLAWESAPLPTLDDGFGDLVEEDVLALTSLLAGEAGFAGETL